ncbi:MAG: DUF1772 domain-containing protein [Gammaproteobacteria bacterium]|nr:DUF1772 domain-containing protein [Gammaproteobacteria bacterium]
MTSVNVFRFLSVLFVAVSMAGGFAHLLELPNKIDLPGDAYLTVQQIYRGWALLGIAVVGALISTITLAVLLRGRGAEFYLAATAAACVAASLAVFFAFTFPANQQTMNWTVLPENWQSLRRTWEYSHAVGAMLYFIALVALTLSLLANRADN